MSNEEQVPVIEGDSPVEPAEPSRSVDTEHAPKAGHGTEPGKASVKGEQPQKESGSTHPGKTSESANGKQSHRESVLGSGPKVAFDMKDVMAQIVGDNAYVNINFYVDMVQGKGIKLSDS